MPRLSTAEATVETLLRHGLDTVYALPGLHSDPLFDAFYHAADRLRVIHPRHEQTAAYMALGAALATGKPQAFAVVPGPGLLNAGAALLTAYGMNAPVIGLVGQIPHADIDRGHGHLHEIHDQLGLMRHITKWAERIRSPHEAPALVSEAIRQATSGRPRPVALECALDTWARRGEVALPDAPLPAAGRGHRRRGDRAAAKILGAAELPILVLGGGALDATAEVVRIAEMLEAPVSSYRRGRGVIASSHRLAVDMPVGHRLWKEADAVLAVGTRFFIQNREWGVDANLKVVRLDIDPEEHDRFRKPDVAIVGNAAPQLRALIAALPRHNRKRASRAAELARPSRLAQRAAVAPRAAGELPQGNPRGPTRGRHLRRRGVADRLRLARGAARSSARAPSSRPATRTISAGVSAPRSAPRPPCRTGRCWRSRATAASSTSSASWRRPLVTTSPSSWWCSTTAASATSSASSRSATAIA